jgi:hypothetical protein
LVLTPNSGPCDATIQVSGSGYGASVEVNVGIARPHSEGSYAMLATPTTDMNGEFAIWVQLGEAGCEVAARDADFDDVGAEDPFLVIFGSAGGSKVAFYEYTTTVATQDLAFSVSPTSGPCDATISAAGSGFPARSEIEISLNRPHSNGSIVDLMSAVTDSSGAFSVLVTLGEFGCVVARLDDEFDDPGEPKELGIAASTNPPGGGIRVVRYGYTTTSLAGEVEATSTASAIGTAQPSATPSSSPTGSGDTGGIDWTDVAIPLGSAMAGAALTALFMMWRRRD